MWMPPSWPRRPNWRLIGRPYASGWPACWKCPCRTFRSKPQPWKAWALWDARKALPQWPWRPWRWRTDGRQTTDGRRRTADRIRGKNGQRQNEEPGTKNAFPNAFPMALHIYNTLSRQTEEFVPFQPPQVRLYTCG